MGDRPTDALWGIGAKTARKLAGIGISTVDELAEADEADLAGAFGPRSGPWLTRLARGESSSRVSAEPWIPRGVSRERTFQRDLTTSEEIHRELDRLAAETTQDVRKEGRPAVRVVVKVRLIPFITKTRSVKLPVPSDDAAAIAAGARAALARFPPIEGPVRLLGVKAELQDPAAPTLDEQPGLGHPLLEFRAPDADDS